MSTQFNDNSAKFELELETSKFKSAAKSAQRAFSNFADKTTGQILDVRQTFSNYLVNDLAGNAIKGAFEKSFEFLTGYAENAKSLVKLADASRLSVEELSKLQAAARGAEVDLTELSTVAENVDLSALNAAPELNLDVGALGELDAADRLAEIIDAFQKIPDAAKRAELATAVFGDSADGLKSILNGATGSTRALIDAAKDAGLIATDSGARGAAQFADALTRLKDVSTGLANSFAGALLPAFLEGAAILTELVEGVSRLTGASSDATENFAQLAESARAAREEGDRLRGLDETKFSFAADLAGQGRLTEETFEKAATAVEELQTKYGDLGFSVDRAARSIELATGAQERFNDAANKQRRAEVEAEIKAEEANLESIQAKYREKRDSLHDGLSVQDFKNAPRNVASLVTFGAVRSSNEKVQDDMDELNVQAGAASNRIRELKAQLEEDADNAGAGADDAGAGDAGADDAGARASTRRGSPVPNDRPSYPTGDADDSASTNTLDVGRQEQEGDPRLDEARLPAQTSETASLDAEIDSFEKQRRRAGQSTERNEIEDVREEEAGYRQRVEQRIVEERSKGKSGQDVALIEKLTAKLEESKTREESRVSEIKSELDREIERTDFRQEAPREKEEARELEAYEKEAQERLGYDDETFAEFKRIALADATPWRADAVQREKDESAAQIEKEAEEYRELLETRLELAETDEERAEAQERLNALQEEVDERREAAFEAVDAEAFKDVFKELELVAPDGLDDDAAKETTDFLEDAYAATEETAKGTAATFSAFDASNLAAAGMDEKALKEAERQTRILDDIYRAMRGGATFA